MELFAISGLAGGLISFLFGSFIFLKDSSSPKNRVFFLIALSGAVWGGAYWQWLANSTNASEALFWVRVLTVGSVMMPAFLYHWVTLVTEVRDSYWKFSVYVLYIVAVLVASAAWTSLMVHGVGPKMIFPYWPTAGPMYLPHIIFIYIFPMIAAAALVLHQYWTSKTKITRGSTWYILLGLLLGGIGAGLNFFLWFDIPVLPYGNFLIVFFPVLLGYSMVKHKVFTVRAIATELLLLLVNAFVFIRMLLADNPGSLFLEFVFFVAIAVASYMLLRSIYAEAEVREHLAKTLRKVKRLNKRLKELDQKKNEFLHIATHQLRSPITAIGGYVSLLKDGDTGKADKETIEVLNKIASASAIMNDTIVDYLDIARIEDGSLEHRPERFDLGEVIAARAEDHELSAAKKKLKYHLMHTKSGECMVHADQKDMVQVINSLIENAIKYTKKGSVTVQCTHDAEQGVVRIQVSDTGIGVPKDALPHLFEKFSRAKNAEEADVFGTGMGLFIAKSLVERNKGTITAESDGEEKGTTFTIELPLAVGK